MPPNYLKSIFQSTDPESQFGHTKLGLTQRERELFESADFDYVGGTLLKREPRESDLPEYLRIDNIMRRTKMTRKQALLYRKYLTRTAPNLYRTFEDWMKKRGVEPGLKYLRRLSMELRSVETPSDDYLENRESDTYTPDYWHPLRDDELPWLFSQPDWVRKFVMRPDGCRNLRTLRTLGKQCYDAERTERRTPVQRRYLALSHDHQSVFWTRYALRKERLERELKLGDTARALIRQIQNARPSALPSLGAKLYRIQQGQIRVRDPPSDDEWRKVWGAYNEYKETAARLPGRS